MRFLYMLAGTIVLIVLAVLFVVAVEFLSHLSGDKLTELVLTLFALAVLGCLLGNDFYNRRRNQ